MSEVLHYVSLPICQFCGGDLSERLVNDEDYIYCLDCGRVQPETQETIAKYDFDTELRKLLRQAGRVYSIVESNVAYYNGLRLTPEYKTIQRLAESQDTVYEKFNSILNAEDDRIDDEIKNRKMRGND